MYCKIIITIWVICGILAYGISFAHWQREYPTLAESSYREDMGFSILWIPLGPLGLIITYFLSGFAEHGLKFK